MPVDDAALHIARARKLWNLMLGSDVHKRIAAGEQFMLLPRDVQNAVQNEPRSWGRKKDVRAEYARAGKRPPLIIKVTEEGQPKAGPVESTLVYSVASGYVYGFTPQKVIGAKRIIISRQDHSAGLANGFVYEGRLYKGSSLNSLPEGIFVDRNKTNQNSLPLERVATRDEAIAAFKSALGEVPSMVQDWAEVPGWTESREKIITSVLNSFA
jgi:hypothetical protein